MPVRFLNSSILKWPDLDTVNSAVREWAVEEYKRHEGLIRLGYFGSYARGDWGVGSDLDLVAVVRSASEPFERRANHWDLCSLPVPAEILIYTMDEWYRLMADEGRFARTLKHETKWLFLSENPVQ